MTGVERFDNKKKIKEFMNYINGCVFSKKINQIPCTGYYQSAVFYIGEKQVMRISTYNDFIEINRIQYNMVKNKLSLEKIDDFIKSYAFYEPTINFVTLKTDSTDLKEISYQIISKYLDEYKKNRVIKEIRITDFTINKVDEIQGNTDKFNFYVDFSLKPADVNSYELTGNGEAKGDWIENCNRFVDVEKVNDEYKVTNMGTSK